MSAAADRLAALLETLPPKLVAISDSQASEKKEGRWSKKQILGHLIDSAGNNHQRWVRAQLAPHLDFPNYAQEQWVAAQHYQSEPWPDLVNLWLLLNRHLVHIARAIAEDCLPHTIAIGSNQPVTLGVLLDDYLSHLEHHLDQIL